MKLKIKKEYIILGLILVILIGFLIFKNTNKTHYKLPKINKINITDIKKVIITKSNSSLTIQKENDKWFIMPEKFIANQSKVDDILNVIAGFTVTDLVSESKNYALYELDDEKKINVKAYSDNEKILREFDMGKTAETYNHTFVKFMDNPNVYYAKENFKSKFDLNTDSLRDKIVLKFDKNQIISITLNNTKENLNIIKETNNKNTDSKNVIWKTDKGKEINSDVITDILNTMSDLSCENYITNKKINDFHYPMYKLTLKGTKEYSISIFKKENDKYSAISTENEFPFLLSSWKAEKIMIKYADLFKVKK